MNLPKDPIMLLSVVNTQLRDFYSSLDEFCKSEGLNKDDLIKKLAAVDYHYHEELNKFM